MQNTDTPYMNIRLRAIFTSMNFRNYNCTELVNLLLEHGADKDATFEDRIACDTTVSSVNSAVLQYVPGNVASFLHQCQDHKTVVGYHEAWRRACTVRTAPPMPTSTSIDR